MVNIKQTDFLIVGAGLAGLYAAFLLKEHGKVTLITKGSLKDSNSYLAQGGIAAAISEQDSIKTHYEDTISAGDFQNNQQNTQLLVKQGRDEVLNLLKLGVAFDRDSSGKLHLTREGAHSNNRILHALGDSTGQVICDTLIELITAHPNIALYQYTPALSLLTSNNDCFGALSLETNKNRLTAFVAATTILATGGLSGIYTTSTANSTVTGDGFALAKEAGAHLKNLQFVQFHPTALANTIKDNCFLISEALRGEGAYLLNKQNQRFMEKYHSLKELAPRHVVSQAIWQEMINAGIDYVYLDTTHLDSEKLAVRFPKIFNTCKQSGFILGQDLVPVKPAAHYSIGGVATNSYGKTDVNNLYAVGEVAYTGVHGSNRLASNSLLECLVFSKRAVLKINLESKKIIDINYHNLNINNLIIEKVSQLGLDNFSFEEWQQDNNQVSQIISKVKDIVYQSMGIIRYREHLLLSKKDLQEITSKISHYNLHPIHQIQLVNLVDLAIELVNQALAYPKNTGCHYLVSKSTTKGALKYAENS